MTVDTATGELIDDLSRDESERITHRIAAKLDTLAETYTTVMPLIREAITRRAWSALGYRSPGEYASTQFGDALAKLDPAMRREVVRELTDAGLSTRAIAPIVGVSNKTVHQDRSGVTRGNTSPQTPEPAAGGEASPGSGQTTPPPTPKGRWETSGNGVGSQDGEGRSDASADDGAATDYSVGSRPAITGIDGKTYSAPKPRALKSVPAAQTSVDQAVELIEVVARNLTVLSQVSIADRRTAIRAAFPIALGKVSPAQTDRFTPEQMRAVADGLHDLADEWEH
jgi:hypothetical protein